MGIITVTNQGLLRLDGRTRLLSQSDRVYVTVVLPDPSLVFPLQYGSLMFGFTRPLPDGRDYIQEVRPLWNLGVVMRLDTMFPRGVSATIGGYLWAVWFNARYTGFSLDVDGV